ncbi:MAG: hypothetical protein RL291_1510 [Pseudomonadota bacterium]|jgi:Flp pilus assembly protein TadG
MTNDLKNTRNRVTSHVVRFMRDESGTTAVEFAMIALPFFSMVFGIIASGLLFFVVSSVERGVWDGSRDLRTGLLQNGGGQYNGLNPSQLKAKFKEHVCNRMPAMIKADCGSNMRVIVQSYGNASSISAPSCTQTAPDGTTSMPPDTGTQFNAGDQNEVVMVTGCYEWTYAKMLPIFQISNRLSNGSYVVQGSATFVTEPFK